MILEGSTHLKEFVMHCSKEFVWRPCEGVIIQLSAGKFKLKSLFSFSNSLSSLILLVLLLLSSLIISELNERFADASILSNFIIFDPRSYVGITTAQELNDFGFTVLALGPGFRPIFKSSTTLAKYPLKCCLNISALRKPPPNYSKFRIQEHILQLWQSFSLSKKSCGL